MGDYTSTTSLIAFALCCAWASGINVYAVLLVLGVCGELDYLQLPGGLDSLSNPLVIFAAGLMYCIEFFADKIPGVDSGWDVLHTFIRIPAAALMAGAFFADSNPDWQAVAQIVGGALALTSHATKTSARLLINTSPEPFTNWGASLSEDALVFAALWVALAHPVLFLVLLLGFLGLVIWLLPKIFRVLFVILNKLRNWLFGAQVASQ
jgi:Domain of unknown function (DUF4126)